MVFLFDMTKNSIHPETINLLKSIFGNKKILKVLHDSRGDALALDRVSEYYLSLTRIYLLQNGIQLNFIADTQVAYGLLLRAKGKEEKENRIERALSGLLSILSSDFY